MSLVQLEIEHFRCINHARLTLKTTNLIVGPNGSGKTTLLEAIYLLTTGHSFRTPLTDPLIQSGNSSFTVVGHVATHRGMEVMGVRGTREYKEAKVNGEPARSFAELAARLPTQAIDPEIHRLLDEGPHHRRRFIDWGVFHVEHRFHDAWRRYQRALRQRNAALKERHSAHTIQIWNQELVEQGEIIAAHREHYLESLQPFLGTLSKRLLDIELTMDYQQGWKKQMKLEAALADSFARDQLRGQTTVGPHRADVILKVDEIRAKGRVSRGQQKMLACVLILAQQAHRAAVDARPACLLLDDPSAELDVDNLGKLLKVVTEIPTQLVVTALTADVLKFFPGSTVFHVEHGHVQAVA